MGKLLDKYKKIKDEELSNAEEMRLEAILKGMTTIQGKKGDRGEKGEKGEKGDKGDKPIAGVDYPLPKDGKDGKDGVNGKDGLTPIPDVDFPGEQGVKKMLTEMLPKDEYFKPLIEKLVKEFGATIAIEAEKIARALEKLKGKEQLDYYALKNRPDIPSDESINTRVRSIMRGGGDTVKTYDLDSLLDGVTKTFTLPTHRKIILVVGTSAPFRFLTTTDYTRTNNSITFTSAVDASISLAAGQGVSILYV